MRTATPISTCSRITLRDVVGDIGVDLDAPVHRARMHDQRVGLGARQFLEVEAEEVEIFALAGHEARCHALALEPQHHDDVGVGETLAHGGVDLDPKPLDARGEQGGGRHDAHPGAERIEQQNVGARHPRMQDIAADGDDQSFDAALVAADGERVEQRLSWVLMAAVAGIDHRAIDLLRQ